VSTPIPERFPQIPVPSTSNRVAPQNGLPTSAGEWGALERAIGSAVGGRVPPRPCSLRRWQILSAGNIAIATIRLPPRAYEARVWLWSRRTGGDAEACSLTATSALDTRPVTWRQGTQDVLVSLILQVADPTVDQTQPAFVEVKIETTCDVDDCAAAGPWGVDLLPLTPYPGVLP